MRAALGQLFQNNNFASTLKQQQQQEQQEEEEQQQLTQFKFNFKNKYITSHKLP